MAFGAPYPAHYWMIPEEEREKRISMPNRDFCNIDQEHFFVRGRFLIPIQGHVECFSWDAWVTQSQQNYQLALDHMTLENREKLDPPTYG